MPTAQVEWCLTDSGLAPVLREGKKTTEIVWAPQPGSQVAFLSCPVFEVLYEGERGPGKTIALVMDYLRDVGKGHGAAWRGVLFRKTFPELDDVITKCRLWIPQIYPTAKYNESSHTWTFADGEQLLLRHFRRPADYVHFHGHEYPWIGWEELGTWMDDKCYKVMFSCCRSSAVGVPCRTRATANPYGIGHNWIKRRFRLKGIPQRVKGPVIRDSYDREGELEPERCYVHGELKENKVLLTATPNYVSNLRAAARNPAELRAWLRGDWDIVAGGMFDDVFETAVHMVPDIPLHLIPKGWYIDRSYDHGSSAPFSVGWWAESNGEPFTYKGYTYGTVPGDLYRIAEWYGWTGEENTGLRMLAGDIAQGIKDRQVDWGIDRRVKPGPADSSIYDPYEGDLTIAGDMGVKGIKWTHADKSGGSRKQGWEQIRKRLKAAMPVPGNIREEPGMFIMQRCVNWERCVPVLPRSDTDPDDVIKNGIENHNGDETRYRLRHKRKVVRQGVFK